jgi:hypothetical protein
MKRVRYKLDEYGVRIHAVPEMRGEHRITRWQADVYLPDGRHYHSRMDSPAEALMELGQFWIERERALNPPHDPAEQRQPHEPDPEQPR